MAVIKNILLFIVSIILTKCQGEVYTAMTDMNRLVATEGELIRTIDNYINSQEQRLTQIRKDLTEMEKVHDLAVENPDAFLGNPLNAFLLIKRLTVDWSDIQTAISEDNIGKGMLKNLTNMADLLKWPDAEDLNGVAIALMRLQDTYKLDTSSLAQGIIQGSQTAYRELTASDCFELGRQSYNSNDHHHTLLWMNEALKKLDKENKPTIKREDIMEYLAFSTYMQGNIKQALKLTNELMEMNPNHERAYGNKIYYEESLQKLLFSKQEESYPEQEAVKKGFTVHERTSPVDSYQRERENYERLCRGEGRLPLSMKIKLHCFYKRGPSLYLLIGPVKSEVVHFNPTVTIFHDVLYESEISNIKELATPRFQRATVQNYKTGELETASYRISKSAWLKMNESSYVNNVNKRISAITGLNLDTAEELQVANYGIGGHYEPHFDYARKEEKDAFKSLGTGNRIATFLFYMSDVLAGGATVFPRIELSLWPEKGAAAFWYNLYPNGEGDQLTRHAACPVLVGQKWVSNKWIHERGQEFKRPCLMHYASL